MKKIPVFNTEISDWVLNAISIMPVTLAVHNFLQIFDEFDNPIYGTRDEIKTILANRFGKVKSRCTNPRQDRIRAEQEIKKNLSLYFPIACPIRRLVEIHKDYYEKDLSLSKKIRLRSEIGKEVECIKTHFGQSDSE